MERLALIVAAAENGVIGNNNSLPWHLPEDLRYFRRTTMGKPIVMGRKTFDSIGKPLPGRTNIVVTRNREYPAEGVEVVTSLDEALSLASDLALIHGATETVVIGGAEIYRLALPVATRLYVTEVHAKVVGDAFLPEIDWQNWQETSREHHKAESHDGFDYSFVQFDRVAS